MTTEITWSISALDCAPSEDGKQNVVKTVHWRCDGVDGDATGSVYSTCQLPAPETDFIAYDELTQETVLGWIFANGIDKDVVEAAVQSQIDGIKAPTIIHPPLPWVAA